MNLSDTKFVYLKIVELLVFVGTNTVLIAVLTTVCLIDIHFLLLETHRTNEYHQHLTR